MRCLAPSPPTQLPGTEFSISKYKFINSLINHTSHFCGAFKNKTLKALSHPPWASELHDRSYHPRLQVRKGEGCSTSEQSHVGCGRGILGCGAFSLPWFCLWADPHLFQVSLQHKNKRATFCQTFQSSREKKFSHSTNTPSVSKPDLGFCLKQS